MARRPASDCLTPADLVPPGRPSVALVASLLQQARAHHTARRHHETSAYLDAAAVALQQFAGDLAGRLDGLSAELRGSEHVDDKNAHNARPGAGAGELAYSHSAARPTSGPGAAAAPAIRWRDDLDEDLADQA